MTNFKKTLMISIISIFTLSLVACQAEKKDVDGLRVTLVTNTAGANDKSFNQGTKEGAERFVEEHGGSFDFIESTSESDYQNNLDTAAQNSDVVIAPGFNLAEALTISAKENPDVKFVGIDVSPEEELDNLLSVSFSEEEAGYLAGYTAGLSTETNKLGFIGGVEMPAVQKFGWGYVAGIKDSNPDAQINYKYTGSFEDIELGRSTANTMFDEDIDIIFHSAGGTGAGVIESAIQRYNSGTEGNWIIGVDRDQYEDGLTNVGDTDSHSIILTSALKKVDVAAYDTLLDIQEDNFTSGEVVLTIKDGAVGLPESNPNLEGKDGVLDSLDDVTERIEAGEFEVPSTLEETEEYLGDFMSNVNGNL